MFSEVSRWPIAEGTLVRIQTEDYDKRFGTVRLARVSSSYPGCDGGHVLYFGQHGEVFRSTEVVDVSVAPPSPGSPVHWF